MGRKVRENKGWGSVKKQKRVSKVVRMRRG